MLLDFIFKGGPVMLPIILGSVIGFAIVIEKYWMFRVIDNFDSHNFVQTIFKHLKKGEKDKAVALCDKNISFPLSAVLKIGIERRALHTDRLEKVLEQVGNNEIGKLEKKMGILASIVSIEPLLGFLGTITGLIRAFMTWEKAGADVTVNMLAGGMYEAMITTAAGLIIAIPLFLCYNYFVSRIKYIGNETTNYVVQLLELLGESSHENKR